MMTVHQFTKVSNDPDMRVRWLLHMLAKWEHLAYKYKYSKESSRGNSIEQFVSESRDFGLSDSTSDRAGSDRTGSDRTGTDEQYLSRPDSNAPRYEPTFVPSKRPWNWKFWERNKKEETLEPPEETEQERNAREFVDWLGTEMCNININIISSDLI